MTISKTATRVSYSGDGASTAFGYPYRVLADADVAVYLKATGGADVLPTLTTHYTVTNTGTEAGITVTMVTAPASGETLTMIYDHANR